MKDHKKGRQGPKGQEINANFKGKRGKYPNSKEALDEDIENKAEDLEGDGTIVKSSDPSSQEWGAREDTNEESVDRHP